jgi:hypothetical protein
MKIKFTEPVTIGSLENRLTIHAMEISTIAFNLRTDKPGHINMSITLRDTSSGHPEHWVYQDDAETLEFWREIKALELRGEPWLTHIARRLMADGKVPQGEIVIAECDEVEKSAPMPSV